MTEAGADGRCGEAAVLLLELGETAWKEYGSPKKLGKEWSQGNMASAASSASTQIPEAEYELRC